MNRAHIHSTQTAEEAITALFELYADDVYRFTYYLFPDVGDPKDVVQEVFLRAFQAWHTYRADASPRTWLLRIARNYIYDSLRKKHTKLNYKRHHRSDLSDVSVPFETLVELESVIDQLSPAYRQVFVLRIIEDLTVAETAAVLGWSQAKVKTTLHRALKQLRHVLSEDGSIAGEEAISTIGG